MPPDPGGRGPRGILTSHLSVAGHHILCGGRVNGERSKKGASEGRELQGGIDKVGMR